MKLSLRHLALASFLSLCSVAHAGKVILPASCGDYKDEFDVKSVATPGTLPAIPDGKAQLVLVFKWETNTLFTLGSIKVRFGTEGKWFGATTRDTYLVATVDPGKHHLCSTIEGNKKWVKELEITPEAGKTYYYEFIGKKDVQPAGVNTSAVHYDFDLVPVTDDEMGAYFVKSLKLAQSEPKSKDNSDQ